MSTYSVAVIADAPVGYWRLEEYSGTTAADSSGNSHDGTLSGNYAQYAYSVLPGFPLAERCVEFNEGRVTVPNHADFSGATAVTLEAWLEVTTSGSSTRHTVLMRGTDDASGLGIIIDDACFTSSGSIRVYAGNAGAFTYTASLDLDTPYHIVVTIDLTATTLYLNGAVVATFAGGTLSLGSSSITIGQQDRVAYEYSLLGYIDEIAFYDSALDAVEVADHYEAGLAENTATADIAHSGMTASGALSGYTPLTGAVEMGAASVTGELTSGRAFETGDMVFGAMTASGSMGMVGVTRIPVPRLAATVLNGAVATLSSTLRPATATGEFDSARTLTGALSLRAARLAGLAANSGAGAVSGTLRGLTLSAQAYAGGLASADAELPALELDAVLAVGGLATAALRLPRLRLEGLTGAQLTTFAAWVLGTKLFSHTTYSNYPFLALVPLGGNYYGVASDGVYVLEGDTDNGDEINADLRTGYEQFGTDALKRILNIYAAIKSDGEVEASVDTDGENTYRTYALLRKGHLSGATRARADVARGLRSRYWQVGVRTRNGADFAISELGALVQKLNRKI